MKKKLIPESWHEKGKKAIDKMDDSLVKLNEKLGLAPLSEAIWNQVQTTRESVNEDINDIVELPADAKEKMEEAISSLISKMPPEFQNIAKGLGLAVIATPTLLTIGCSGDNSDEIARKVLEKMADGGVVETTAPDVSTLTKMTDWLCDMVASGALGIFELIIAGGIIHALSQFESAKDWGREEIASYIIATFGALTVGFSTQSFHMGLWLGGVGGAAGFNTIKGLSRIIKRERFP